MAKKTPKTTKEHKQIIKAHGLFVLMWKVAYERPDSLIVWNWFTGEFKVIEKEVVKV